MSNEYTDIAQAKGSTFGKEWLTAEELHPDIRRKRVKGKGYEYHINAANLSVKKEETEVPLQLKDEQLGLWIQLWRTMKPHSRDKLLQLALAQVAKDLATPGDDK
jgi:hypothetical protein